MKDFTIVFYNMSYYDNNKANKVNIALRKSENQNKKKKSVTHPTISSIISRLRHSNLEPHVVVGVKENQLNRMK